MSRFAGLPNRNTEPSPGARFASLPDELASMRQPARIDHIRAVWANHCSESSIDAAYHRDDMARLGTTKATTANPTPAGPKKTASTVATPSKPAASAPPKPLPLAIPADVAATGPEAVAAFKQGHARAEARLSALAKHPAAAGRSAEVLSMFRAGKTDTEIVAHLTKGQRAKAADAVWARAIAKVHGPPSCKPAALSRMSGRSKTVCPRARRRAQSTSGIATASHSALI